MNILNGIISLGISFWMYIYLYGLDAANSAMYNSSFYIFPTIFLLISVFCFCLELRKLEFIKK